MAADVVRQTAHGDDGGQADCRCVYKPAPAESQVGDVIELTQDEQVELATWTSTEQKDLAAPLAEAIVPTSNTPTEQAVVGPQVSSLKHDDDEADSSAWQRMAKLWGVSENQP